MFFSTNIIINLNHNLSQSKISKNQFHKKKIAFLKQNIQNNWVSLEMILVWCSYSHTNFKMHTETFINKNVCVFLFMFNLFDYYIKIFCKPKKKPKHWENIKIKKRQVRWDVKKNGLNSSQNLSKTRKSCFKKIVQHTFVDRFFFINFNKPEIYSVISGQDFVVIKDKTRRKEVKFEICLKTTLNKVIVKRCRWCSMIVKKKSCFIHWFGWVTFWFTSKLETIQINLN